ncbi:hypothetical protein L7F22_004958 [Adiantum nelumboides]|nr:hypothetical protein [Adiantum nelumboides]
MERASIRAFGIWWEALERSELWQKGVFYALFCGYELLALSALLLLCLSCLVLYAHGGRWRLFGFVYSKLSDTAIADIRRRKRLWLLPLLVFAQIRALSFYAVAANPLLPYRSPLLTTVLLDLPGLVFFSICTLFLLSLWIDLCHRPSFTEPSRLTKPIIITVNVAMYAAQMLMWASEYLVQCSTKEGYVERAASLAFAAVWFATGLAFFGYGVALCRRLGKRGSWGRVRRRMRSEVARSSMICVLFFAARAGLIGSTYAGSAIYARDMHVDLRRHPLINLVFYVLLELLPCAILVFLKRQLPGKLLPHHSADYLPLDRDTLQDPASPTPSTRPLSSPGFGIIDVEQV